MKKILYIFLVFTSVISSIICIIFNNRIAKSYSMIIFFPIIYCIFSIFLCDIINKPNKGGKITVLIYLILQWLRNVLFPAVATLSGYLNLNNSFYTHYERHATYICLYELILSMLLCYAILKFSSKKTMVNNYSLAGNINIYWIFILFSFVIYLCFGRNMFYFLRLDLTGTRLSRQTNNISIIYRTIINYGLTFALINILYITYKKYNLEFNKKNIYICIIICMFRLCIISSEGRLSILITLLALVYILPQLFPKYKKFIILNVIFVGIFVIALMTIYKTFSAFLYSSYSEAIFKHSNKFDLYSISSLINSNFYGVQTVTKNLYVSKFINCSIETYFIDIFRNTFILQYLFPSNTLTTIAAYNMYIYDGTETSGYLYSSIAYGVQYYTYLFCPLATIINILLISYVESWLYRIKQFEILYIITIIYFRLAITMFACLPLSWNYITRNLIISFTIIYGASLFMNNDQDCTLQFRSQS